MKIIRLEKQHLNYARDFIEPFEYRCCLLAQNIRQSSENLYVVIKGQALNGKEDFAGIFNIDKNFLHCFPLFFEKQFEKVDKEDLKQLFISFFEGKNIKCLTGEHRTNEFFLQILEQMNYKPQKINIYKSMILDDEMNPPPEELSLDDEIRRCTTDNLEELIPLQKDYLLKEVAIPGQQISSLEASVSLKQIFKNQLCFALYSDDEPVAKANTNAIGFNYIQIGGVYTHPLYRRNYYAWHLMYKIAKRIILSRKKVTLFVKIQNESAKSLYKRQGFIEAGDFSISYF
ncbi:MAG: GNAT family N-acetyltransferase [Treponema sp.]|nr:GNAT family N-acetyltransferase [Treponema sp.]